MALREKQAVREEKGEEKRNANSCFMAGSMEATMVLSLSRFLSLSIGCRQNNQVREQQRERSHPDQ